MYRSHRKLLIGLGALAALLAAMVGCSTDSPTAPVQQAAPPPGSSPPSATWNITVSVDPPQIDAGSSDPVTVRVQVRRASDGAAPANGTTLVVETTLGELISLGSEAQSAALSLINGIAQVLLFPGTTVGEALITARLETSVGQRFLQILDGTLFISSVSPNSGPEQGGTRITIEGTGFSEPLRVTVDDRPADLVSVSNDRTRIIARTPAILDPETFFTTQPCDTDGDGTEDGERLVPKSVNVQVQLQSGTNAALANSFTYNPKDTRCRAPEIEPPTADFSVTINGLTVIFANLSTGGGTLSYQWVFGDGDESTTANPTHTYDAAGTYEVTLQVTNSEGVDTKSRKVTVPDSAPPVTADFGVGSKSGLTVTFVNLSSGADSYLWQFGDGTVSTATAPSHTYALAGTYTVRLTAENNEGGSDTASKSVTVP